MSVNDRKQEQLKLPFPSGENGSLQTGISASQTIRKSEHPVFDEQVLDSRDSTRNHTHNQPNRRIRNRMYGGVGGAGL